MRSICGWCGHSSFRTIDSACSKWMTSENLCVPAAESSPVLSGRAAARGAAPAQQPVQLSDDTPDLRASHVFYICPRPVVLVSVEHEGAGNLFPMDLIGPTDSPWFSMALRSTSPAVRLMQRSRRMALAEHPVRISGNCLRAGQASQAGGHRLGGAAIYDGAVAAIRSARARCGAACARSERPGISRGRFARALPDFGGTRDCSRRREEFAVVSRVRIVPAISL